MNFSSAFKYPFQNFAKVMSIVLVLTIALSVFIAIVLNSYDWAPFLRVFHIVGASESTLEAAAPLGGTTLIGIFGFLLTVCISGFWLSGYSIEVVRAVMRGEEWMPGVDIGRNIKDGALIFISSLGYLLLFILLIAALGIANGLFGQFGILSALAVMVSILASVVAICLMGWAYFVGMARFAMEGDYRASWQLRENMRIARKNWQKGLMLLLYTGALTIIYGIVRGIVDGVFGGLMGANLLAGITLSIIIYYVLNLTQHFSTQHLIAQYAAEIGLRGDHYVPEKDKVDAS